MESNLPTKIINWLRSDTLGMTNPSFLMVILNYLTFFKSRRIVGNAQLEISKHFQIRISSTKPFLPGGARLWLFLLLFRGVVAVTCLIHL